VIEIIFENDVMLAVNKPSGLLTQAVREVDSLESRVKLYLWNKLNESVNSNSNSNCNSNSNNTNTNTNTNTDIDISSVYLGIPHRLDRPVSGVILFGKNSRAANRLSRQFEKRQINKIYWAVVSGDVENSSGTWIDYMRKIPNRPVAEIVEPIIQDAKVAILHYRVLKKFEFSGQLFSLLEIKLETGRMHQIRLQAAAHGHPILGDATYGATLSFGENFNDERNREIALHARSISFIEPITQQQINLQAPIPNLWDKLKIEIL
jgi:RluA family pseudouridine synthase